MKRITAALLALTLSSIALAAHAQPDLKLITLDSEGFWMQSSPGDAPLPLGIAPLLHGWSRPVFSRDQRYLAQVIDAPEYLALPPEQQRYSDTLPANIVLVDVQTGETRTVAGQPDDAVEYGWILRTSPTWSPSTHQFAYIELGSQPGGPSLHLYDVETGTATLLAQGLPMGYSDAGIIGIPSAHWSEAGIFTSASNVSEDHSAFVERLTLVDPGGQVLVDAAVIGTTLNGEGWSRDSAVTVVGGLDARGGPVILMENTAGEWFIPGFETSESRWIGTPILRPRGGGDIQLYLVRVTELDPEQRRDYPHYRAFIRRGGGMAEALDLDVGGSVFTEPQGMFYAAPYGDSVIFRRGSEMVQWFGPGDSRVLDLGGRRIVDWGDWVLQQPEGCALRPTVALMDRPVRVQVVRDESVPIYSAPGRAARVTGEAVPGTFAAAVAGPLCMDQVNWYQIAVDGVVAGWVESTGAEDPWIEAK